MKSYLCQGQSNQDLGALGRRKRMPLVIECSMVMDDDGELWLIYSCEQWFMMNHVYKNGDQCWLLVIDGIVPGSFNSLLWKIAHLVRSFDYRKWLISHSFVTNFQRVIS